MQTIYETKFGLEQKDLFRNMDLYEEEIPDMEFSGIFKEIADPILIGKKFKYLIFGDQNAGKTTFLSLFCTHENASFMEIFSFVPSICVSFINCRFFLHRNENRKSIMDELPFLDTDIGRTAILMSMQNYDFLIEELSDKSNNTSEVSGKGLFAVLELVEFGGDHLDRLVEGNHFDDFQDEDKKLRMEILEGTRNMIKNASKGAVYFLNFKSLVDGNKKLYEKLSVISRFCPGIRLFFLVTRVDSLEKKFEFGVKSTENFVTWERYGNFEEFFEEDSRQEEDSEIEKQIFMEIRNFQLDLNISGVRVARHIQPQTGRANVREILRTLSVIVSIYFYNFFKFRFRNDFKVSGKNVFFFVYFSGGFILQCLWCFARHS